ncbi:hypothetical protein BDV96DRAFT_654713 [Lophiotrema nucula]|uniref:Uncharacterized protein n=1 Tax=Lophiotrema nucula TaxID=690887 RepID=A0A6A5YHY1_9PLEO|nr:hypothetical protein BDV96DRAFT_654713 [Lophiotrema nucula]
MYSQAEEVEEFRALKKQVLTSAYALFGQDYPKADHYDVIITRSKTRHHDYEHDNRRTSYKAALIVYLYSGTKSTWKLLEASNKKDSDTEAIGQLNQWLREDLGEVMADMRKGDVHGPTRRGGQRLLEG